MGSGKGTKTQKMRSTLGPKKSSFQKVSKTSTLKRSKEKRKKASYNEGGAKNESEVANGGRKSSKNNVVIEHPTASQQLSYFLGQYQSANRIRLSSIELEAYKDEFMLELQDETSHTSLSEKVKSGFGSSYREVLCEKQLVEGKVEPGNPALLVISSSAIRSLELFREFRPLTRDCPAVKLFSKHMKIEEQVSFLKNRVNIACGTPNRIKKLIDLEALGLSQLSVIVLDMYTDVKGYSLFTLPQVRFDLGDEIVSLISLNSRIDIANAKFEFLSDLFPPPLEKEEFWDLYKSHFHERLLEGSLRIFLHGKITATPPTMTDATNA